MTSSSQSQSQFKSNNKPFLFKLNKPNPIKLPSTNHNSIINSTSPRYPSFSNSNSIHSSSLISIPKINHFSKNINNPSSSSSSSSTDPHALNLLLLDDPDQVFRLFGVRAVTTLEIRAKEAADAKVSELRTMVGERYRDLLSAADSIVRMKVASDKLVTRLNNVNHGLTLGTLEPPPSKRARYLSGQANVTATASLDLAPTLSLIIQLLLSIPSHVHSLLESSAFLSAARLEGVGRVLHRVIESYDSEEIAGGSLKDKFPIIERQWEMIAALGAVIVRRATAELRICDASPIILAQTLASIVILDNITLRSALTLLLDARSKRLSAILDSMVIDKQQIDQVIGRTEEAIETVLSTVHAANILFGAAEHAGLLLQLLEEIETPSLLSNSSTQLPPILSMLPNYITLSRYLPDTILNFSPSIASSHATFSSRDASIEIQSWLTQSNHLVVEGVKASILHLGGGASTLRKLWTAICTRLLDYTWIAKDLERQLGSAIEDRFRSIYQQHLSTLVTRVPTCLTQLVSELSSSPADLDTAHFLFEMQLPFPSPTSTIPSAKPVNDPLTVFRERVLKRLEGKSPLLDRGLNEMETSARILKDDLQDWLMITGCDNLNDTKFNLRDQYLATAEVALGDIYAAILASLNAASSNVDESLFVGNFASQLARSSVFTRDLLLLQPDITKLPSVEAKIIQDWESQLLSLQLKSLNVWRSETVTRAMDCLDVPVNSSRTADDDIDIASVQPSTNLIAALHVLLLAINKIGPQRTRADPSIVSSLMEDFDSLLLANYVAFLDKRDPMEAALGSQMQWDIAFFKQLRSQESSSHWSALESRLTTQMSTETFDLASCSLSTRQYLQTTQTLFSPLLSPSAHVSTARPGSLANLLHLGSPLSSAGGFQTNSGIARPGIRLGLLPTRS